MEQPSFFEIVHAPYYISIGDYTAKSAGHRALYYLCHVLNELGQEAYILGSQNEVTHLRAPRLQYKDLIRHQQAKRVPITLYPEVISGNPWNMPHIVRWLLNKAGHLGGDETFDASDMVFVYTPDYIPEGDNTPLLTMPAVDMGIFNNRDNPYDNKREGTVYYAHKYLLKGGQLTEHVQNSQSLCQDVDLTQHEIADILRRSELLYCYEPSAIIWEALLCGCPVVIIPTPYLAENLSYPLEGPGIAVSPSAQDIAYAKSTIHECYDLRVKQYEECWQHVYNFIELTQTEFAKRDKSLTAAQRVWGETVRQFLLCNKKDDHADDARIWHQNNLLLSNVLAIHEQTSIPALMIAMSILDKKQDVFTSDEDRELFLLKVCKAIFDGIADKDATARSRIDDDQLQHILTLLKSDRFTLLSETAFTLRQQIFDWQLNVNYQRWIENHALQEIDAQLHAERMMRWAEQPCFHLVMFLFDNEYELLADTIDSLDRQFYKNWKLTVIADSEAPDPIFEQVEVLQWIQFPAATEPYSFINKVITEQISSDWILFVPAGIQLEPQAFLQFGDYIDRFQDKLAFYCDDDLVDMSGQRYNPRFKPDFNLDLLRSSDYIGQVLCHRDLFKAINGLSAFPGHENMDLAFKIIERVGINSIQHISEVLIHLPDTVLSYRSQAITMQVVQAHLQRLGTDATVEKGLLDDSVRVVYHSAEKPQVSIIIPTKDKVEFLRPCIDSVLKKNDYPNFEILVINNQSQDPDTLTFFAEIQHAYPGLVRVLDYPYPFNYAAISNAAAQQAYGEYLLFLNNDTEALHPQWLTSMMNHAMRPEVGVVGARLVYPETGVVQHIGTILGLTDIAGHPNAENLEINEPGYMGRAQLDQDFSAVTGACLLVRKSLYEQVGGMDEDNLAVLFNDIDLCLKIRQEGLLVVWTPSANLVHHHSISIKSDGIDKQQLASADKEREYMLRKWRPVIANDPAYNRHLSLANTNTRIESGMPVNWDVNFHERTRVMAMPLEGGSGEYRVVQPLDALSHAAVAQCEYYRFGYDRVRQVTIPEYARMAPDVVIFQAALNDVQLDQIEKLASYLPEIYRIYTLDDLVSNVPEQSSAYKSMKRHFSDAKARIRRALKSCNRLIVSTQPLADLCAEMCDDIRVIPNYIKRDPWTRLISLRNQGEKPRVGWAGAQQHQGDLQIIVDVVKETAEEIDWIFMGLCPDELRPYIKEYHGFVDIADYPKQLASLNLDLALAPLEIHPFNESKSNLRLLEYGVLGWPVICTDIYPYRTNNPPVTLVNNDRESWLSAIHDALADPAALQQAGAALKQWVMDNYILEEHLSEWQEALNIV